MRSPRAELATLLPYDQPARRFDTLITWGRQPEVLEYDENSDTVTGPSPTSTTRTTTMTTPIGELLTPADVFLDVDARTRDELLMLAARRLAPSAGVPARVVYDHLRARESLGSTALGHGVALPHARMPIGKPVAAFLRARSGIDYQAPDGRPVRFFLVLLVPLEAVERHLALTACAARQFGDPAFRARMRTANLPREIADLFSVLPK